MSETKATTYSSIINKIKSSQKILIASHRDPDGDSIGSQLALYNFIRFLGKKADVVGHGEIPYKYGFLPEIGVIKSLNGENSKRQYDLAIILDCSILDRIGEVENLIGSDTFIINIDHHPDNTAFGNLNLVRSDASSIGEMLTEIFLEASWNFERDTATLLYTAILTDTGRFRFDSVNRRTMEIAGILLDRGVSPREITDKVYFSMPPSILKMTGQLLSQMEFYDDNRICIMGLDKDKLALLKYASGDMEGLAEYTLYGQNTVVGGLLKEQPDNSTKVSLRSRKAIDVSKLAQKYGGGGHTNAAGCIFKMPFDQTRDKLVEELRGLLNGSL